VKERREGKEGRKDGRKVAPATMKKATERSAGKK
jgi:hypothetical protein